jgi:hypothetical protein
MTLSRHGYLNGKVSSIDIVSQEEVSGICRVASNLEQLHQIIVLSVYISAHYFTTGQRMKECNFLVSLSPVNFRIVWECIVA